jgi:Plant transposon protein
MQKHFVTAQEAKRKDIERAFGILQARFHVLTSGCRLWDRRAMDTVIRTCVILHNLVIDYEREHNLDGNYINDMNYVPLHNMEVVPRNPNQNHVDREMMIDDMQNIEHHNLLQHDLMVERWEQWFAEHGDENMDMDDIV